MLLLCAIECSGADGALEQQALCVVVTWWHIGSRFQITFICQVESTQEERSIVLCQDQAFEDFLDLIVNEFGTQFWPAMINPLGGIMVIDSDDAFEMLVRGNDTQLRA